MRVRVGGSDWGRVGIRTDAREDIRHREVQGFVQFERNMNHQVQREALLRINWDGGVTIERENMRKYGDVNAMWLW